MTVLQKLLHYVNPATAFRRPKHRNPNLFLMHGINRISILMFLVAVAVIIVRALS